MNNFKFSRKQGYLVSLVLIVFTICGSHAQSGKSNFIRTYTPRVPILDQTLVKPDMAIQDAQQTTAHFDGLGRMSQVMVRGASPEGMLNSTSAIRYGSDGSREEFLPLPIINSTDRLMSDVYNMTNQYYLSRKNASDAYAYTRVDMLDRPIESRLPGDAVKAISTIYRPGNASDEIDEIVFTAGTNQLSRLGYYSNGALKVTITTDQNDHQVIEYTNKLEQMVCKSSQANEAGTVFAKTYYVYDDYGNLTFIIPPEASKEALLDWSKLDDPVFRNDWFFQYRYDKRQRMIEKKMPGIAPTHMVYDNRDRLVLTQDGNQRGGSLIEVTSSQSTSAYIPNTNYVITSGSLTLTDGFHATGDFLATTNGNQLTGEWLFTKYDELNRPVLTGQVQLTGSRHEVQQLVDTDPSYNFTTTFIGNTGADLLGYDNTNFARTIPEVLSVSYYDNYNFMTLPEWGLPVSSPTGAVARARTLPTGIKTKVLGSNDFLDEVLYYDIRFRLVQNVKENHLGGTDTWTNTYVNDVLNLISQTQREHVASGQTTVVVDRYEYDHLNRVTNHYHRMGTDPANEILLVSHHYNDIGELEVKDVGEAQKQDYTYNIKGWLQSINGGTDFNDVSDVFGMELKYADASSGHQQYNGNIGEISWKSVAGSGNDDAQTYRFKYDPLNRLKKATYTSLNRANHYNVFGNGADNTILYDLNGNIKSLKRNFDGNQVDNLDYAY
ncbi:MAG: hypothetical protein KI790_10990 [Cyclobacteriaceae bacterium]|nr:hypothetical protein [Cyclobacteriaceae bacterium HetDA_MAG_MS6]